MDLLNLLFTVHQANVSHQPSRGRYCLLCKLPFCTGCKDAWEGEYAGGDIYD